MYKIFFSLITLFIIVLTLCIGLKNPPMHKSVLIYDSDYKIVETKQETVVTKNIPTKNNVKSEPKTFKKLKAQELKTKNTLPVQTISSKKAKQIVPIKKTRPVTEKQTSQTQQKLELIQWNKWRSDIQNQIMEDVELPIMPEGTIFKFTFDVDKYGKISHVQTWSTNPACTPYAIQFIAPVIRSYQGHSLLNFPAGSNRISTSVEGGWKISQTSKYSTPKDYKDSEKIIK